MRFQRRAIIIVCTILCSVTNGQSISQNEVPSSYRPVRSVLSDQSLQLPVETNLSENFAHRVAVPLVTNTGYMIMEQIDADSKTIDKSTQSADPEKHTAQTEKLERRINSAYKGVFFDNNFDYLSEPGFCGPYYFGDRSKNLFNKLDFGGELRTRFHRERGIRGLGLSGRDDDFWLSRARFYSNLELSPNIRIFGEYLYADSGGEDFNNRPIEENRNEIQNLFVDFKFPEIENGKFSIRLGRQELLFGAQRLVSPLDWANTRRTFQGGRATLAKGPLKIDAFLVNPVNRNGQNESSIDEANGDVTFFGSYATMKQKDGTVLDIYFLGLDNNLLDFDNQTLGSRIKGRSDRFLYEIEGGFQFGRNSDGTGHDAGFATCGIGKELYGFANPPLVWFWYDWASGGDESFIGRGDDSFDHQFPLAHKYLGLADLFGRRNINDANIQLIKPFQDARFQLLVWYHYLFLHEKTTPYGVTLVPFNTTALAGDRELGHELDLMLTFRPNPRNRLTVGYSQFFSGNYYNTTPGVPSTGDGSFFYSEYQIRF